MKNPRLVLISAIGGIVVIFIAGFAKDVILAICGLGIELFSIGVLVLYELQGIHLAVEDLKTVLKQRL